MTAFGRTDDQRVGIKPVDIDTFVFAPGGREVKVPIVDAVALSKLFELGKVDCRAKSLPMISGGNGKTVALILFTAELSVRTINRGASEIDGVAGISDDGESTHAILTLDTVKC